MPDSPEPLQDIAALDAEYVAPPPFSEWSRLKVGSAVWDDWLLLLEQRRAELSAEQFDELRARLMRQAAIETGAIEGLYETDRGFTYTTAALAAGWEAAVEREKGRDVALLIEGQMEAYELALDIAARARPITEVVIREMHELACRGQSTYDVVTQAGPQEHALEKGTYKRHPNHVLQPDGTTHSYAPVDDTAMEMARLVEDLNHPAFENAHPAMQAAYAHHAFVAIHPFSDGNGRVARLLASVYLMRATSVPLVLFSDDRPRYLAALRAADSGDLLRWARFVLDRTVDAMMYLNEETRRFAEAGAEPPLAVLARRVWGPGGLSLAEADATMVRLLSLVEVEIRDYFRSEALPETVTLKIAPRRGPTAVPAGYRSPKEGPHVLIVQLRCTEPVAAELATGFTFAVATQSDVDFGFLIQGPGRESLPVRTEDIYPTPTRGFELRLRAWLGRHLDRHVRAFAQVIDDATRN